jgi:hypothetical protein
MKEIPSSKSIQNLKALKLLGKSKRVCALYNYNKKL